MIKAFMIFLAAWMLFMAFLLRGEDAYPFPANIGGEWLRLKGDREPTGSIWEQLLKSTALYFPSHPIQRPDEARQTGWKGYHSQHYSIGLQWKILL